MGDNVETINKPTILIIGDWFIDENWLVSKHNSSNSSHTGEFHYLSKHDDVGKRMTSLCGVPEILEMIKKRLDDYKILSFGVWNKLDEDIIKCIMCDKGDENLRKNLTIYKLRGLDQVIDNKCPYIDGDCDFNNKHMMQNLSKDKNCSTNRIIRIYEGHSGSKPNLLYRFDWELELVKEKIEYEKIFEAIKMNDIKAVIIEDHNKGVITSGLIELLISRLPNINSVKWYIRSKVENPKWLDILISKCRVTT